MQGSGGGFAAILRYTPARYVKHVLSGEDHRRQEFQIGNRSATHIARIQEGYTEPIDTPYIPIPTLDST
jgi:hypothetical protein